MAESKPKELWLSPLMAGAFGRLKTRKKREATVPPRATPRAAVGTQHSGINRESPTANKVAS